jgi:hypothetical protein
MEPLTNENKSAVDLACDAESWGSFELLKSAADDRYPRINVPYRRRGSHLRSFFPSEFFVKLRNTIDDHMENIGLKDFEDMIQRTRELKAAGQLSAMVPYPEENYHLISESLVLSATILVSQLSDNLRKYHTSTQPQWHLCSSRREKMSSGL